MWGICLPASHGMIVCSCNSQTPPDLGLHHCTVFKWTLAGEPLCSHISRALQGACTTKGVLAMQVVAAAVEKGSLVWQPVSLRSPISWPGLTAIPAEAALSLMKPCLLLQLISIGKESTKFSWRPSACVQRQLVALA